jgi:putative transposase
VLNRAIRRDILFDRPEDYSAFMRSLGDAQQRAPIPLLAYCVMPNHFHLVVGPTVSRDLSRFMHRLTVIHSKRWHANRGTYGTGPVYQGRFKAYSIQDDQHFLVVCRYVERNPVRADLVQRAEDWPWSSLSRGGRDCDRVELSPWPILQPPSWMDVVNDGRDGGNRVS